MIEINEVIMLLLGIGLILGIRLNINYLKKVPRIKILTSAFYVLFASFVFTIVEGFFLRDLFNLLEHLCYLLSPLLLLLWCYLVMVKGKAV
ncbi:MAG: hypothetical protein PHX97_03755 [Dehalococcoidales bacterium]|nr:hypothetical protein [Dehalococcoidales bacterium]